MWMHRMILHAELQQARFPEHIVCGTINAMRREFYPVENLDTRVFSHATLKAVCIQISLPGSCCPANPRGEVMV